MSDEEIEDIEKQVPALAVAALNAASREAAASGLPLVLRIDDGLYRVSPSGEKELIRMLPPRTKASDLESRGGA